MMRASLLSLWNRTAIVVVFFGILLSCGSLAFQPTLVRRSPDHYAAFFSSGDAWQSRVLLQGAATLIPPTTTTRTVKPEETNDAMDDTAPEPEEPSRRGGGGDFDASSMPTTTAWRLDAPTTTPLPIVVDIPAAETRTTTTTTTTTTADAASNDHDEPESTTETMSSVDDAATTVEESATDETQSSQEASDSSASPENDTTRSPAVELVRRQLLVPSPKNKKKNDKSSSSSRKNTRTTTSVGPRRVGSATRARASTTRTTSRIVETLRKKARVATAASPPPTDTQATKPSSPERPAPEGDSSTDFSAQFRPDALANTIDDLLDNKQPSTQAERFVAAVSSFRPTVGLLGQPSAAAATSSVLLQSADGTLVRTATPQDDVDVANLRLSVFADFAVDQRGLFCARSCEAMAQRRRRGAVCVVATNRGQRVQGTAECSFHEFGGTELGARRALSAILYVTEVAVHPQRRRRGIGRKLLEGIDRLAKRRNIETIYLHVDVCNTAAVKLYETCGYQKTDATEPLFAEFTQSLNLHPGATRGRTHYLMYKDLENPTWLPRGAFRKGTLGFEIPV